MCYNHVVHDMTLGATISVFADDAGEVHALSSTCTHRGAQLSKGTVEVVNGHSCVRCPYHAWAFSGDGKVQDIPVQSDGCFPKRALQQSYNLRIQGNLLWMFWGQTKFTSDEYPPIPGPHHRDVCSKVLPPLAMNGCIVSCLSPMSFTGTHFSYSYSHMHTAGIHGGITCHQDP